MASHNSFSNYYIFFLVFSCFNSKHVSSFEYQVGGNIGWAVPPRNNTNIYNDWASENRFTVGDTLHFRYKKDSVLEVNVTEYSKCNSKRPHFFSNTGNTLFNLNRSGPFFFVSGATGHCDMGQHMIVKVMVNEDSRSDGGRSSSVTAIVVLVYTIIAQSVFSCFF